MMMMLVMMLAMMVNDDDDDDDDDVDEEGFAVRVFLRKGLLCEFSSCSVFCLSFLQKTNNIF